MPSAGILARVTASRISPPSEPSAADETAALRAWRIAKHFPYFLAVAEEQNLHRAAERLSIAQSALSRRIRDLENELDQTALFERQARGVRLTAAGRQLMEDVRAILLSIENARRQVRRMAQGELGRLRIGFTEAMIRGVLLPAALRRFRDRFPHIQMAALPLTSEAQRQRLRDGEMEVGFVIEEEGDAGEFEALRVGTDHFSLVLPTDHPLAARAEARLADVTDTPLIWPSQQHSPRLFDRMLAAFQRHSLTPHIAVEVSTVDAAFGLVAAGMGLAIVTATRPDRAPPDVALRPIADLDLTVSLTMIWPRQPPTPPVANFVAMIRAGLSG
jgi:DNA-binding transcriptional LysR family regulator